MPDYNVFMVFKHSSPAVYIGISKRNIDSIISRIKRQYIEYEEGWQPWTVVFEIIEQPGELKGIILETVVAETIVQAKPTQEYFCRVFKTQVINSILPAETEPDHDQLIERRKKRRKLIRCDCGITVSQQSIYKHKYTSRHIRRMLDKVIDDF